MILSAAIVCQPAERALEGVRCGASPSGLRPRFPVCITNHEAYLAAFVGQTVVFRGLPGRAKRAFAPLCGAGRRRKPIVCPTELDRILYAHYSSCSKVRLKEFQHAALGIGGILGPVACSHGAA